MNARKARPSAMTFANATPIGAPTAPFIEPESSKPTKATKLKEQPEQARTAFTWRLTTERALQFDGLVLRLRSQLASGRRLNKADVVEALLDLAEHRDDIRAALLTRLEQTS